MGPGDDKWRHIDDYALRALVQAQIVAALQRLPAEQRLPMLRQAEAELPKLADHHYEGAAPR